MSKKIFIFTFVLALTFGMTSCMPRSGETTPEMARNILKLRGYKVTEADFFRAIRSEDATAVKGFLQAGMNPNAKNKDGETALVFAIQNVEPKIAAVLLEKADPNLKDDTGSAPIHLAVDKNKEEVLDLLLEKNADVNTGGRSGNTQNQTALYAAVIKGRADLAQKLLDKGADPNISDSDGGLPLSEAAIRGDAELVGLMLDKGAKIDAQEPNKRTALIYAASSSALSSQKRTATIRLLLERGADKAVRDEAGKTALDWAKQNKNRDAAGLLN